MNLLTADEVAELLRISPNTLRHWVCREVIPHVKLQGTVRFIEDDLLRWISEHSRYYPAPADDTEVNNALDG